MKKKVHRKNYPELDKFDRKQKKHTSSKNKSPKQKLSIYDEFEDEDLKDNSTSGFDEYEF